MRKLGQDKRGVVYVEFLLVFPPLFLLFLVILQSAILRATDIGVRHAASGAVRSAIVVLPDDPVAYEGHKKNKIFMDSSCSEGFSGKFAKVLEKLGMPMFELPKDGKCPGGPRMAAIRFMAIMRMLPFSPNPQSILPGATGRAFAGLGKTGWIAGAAAYSYGATAVTFPNKASGSKKKKSSASKKQQSSLTWKTGDDVTVRVSYLAHCGIPIARFFMCDSSYSLMANHDLDFYKRDFRGRQAASKRLKSSAATRRGMSTAVGNSTILALLLFSGERFMVLSADATLPLNAAPYDYQKKEP